MAPKPYYKAIDKQTEERKDLYIRRDPPGAPIPSNVRRTPRADHLPLDEKLRWATKESSNGWTGGIIMMRAENLKEWLRGMERDEKAVKEREEGYKGADYRRRLLVKLRQHILETGKIPHQMLLTVVVLIPKGASRDFCGTGLLEVIWKLLEIVLDKRLLQIELHDFLNGFRAKWGCGTGIMEAKLLQQLAAREQVPLYSVLLDLWKAFDAMDQERCLAILKQADVGPKALGLVRNFWDKVTLICCASGYSERPFSAGRDVTQGRPLSSTIFSIMVDVIIREWVRLMKVGGINTTDIRIIVVVFYANDRLVAAQDPKIPQNAFNILTELFDWVDLRANTTKTKVMVFLPGRIRAGLSEQAYLSRMDNLYRESRKGGGWSDACARMSL